MTSDTLSITRRRRSTGGGPRARHLGGGSGLQTTDASRGARGLRRRLVRNGAASAHPLLSFRRPFLPQGKSRPTGTLAPVRSGGVLELGRRARRSLAGARHGVDRRPRTRPCWRRPICCSTGRPRSSTPTPPTSRRHAAGGLEGAAVDRLRLDDARLEGMASGLRGVAALPDPVGEVLDGTRRPERPRHPAGACAARSRGDHLREPPERDQRRGRDLPEVGQRGAPARLLDRAAIQPGDRGGAPRRPPRRSVCPPTR